MRRIVAYEYVSLDGVMESPENWAFQYHGNDMTTIAREQMESSDALLLGRTTFQLFQAYWPNSNEEPFASHINGVTKYCVSTADQDLSWGDHAPARLISGNVFDEIGDLKQGRGKDLSLVGSATLLRSMLAEGLIDELQLYVHPVVLGRGASLFNADLELKVRLIDTYRFDKAVVLNKYVPLR